MPDSPNILSVLQMLGPPPGADAPDVQLPGVAQGNVLQSVSPQAMQAPPQPALPPPPPPPQPAASPDQVVAAANANSPAMPEHKRRSLLDTIGRISDVLATVGGAHPLYQPTLDAATARTNAATDQDLKTQKSQIDLATSKFALGDSDRTRWANALGSIHDAEDAALWPQISEAAGLDPTRAAAIGKILTANPDSAKVFASALGGDAGDENKLGKNLYFGTDTNGKTVAYQIGEDGAPHILDFGGKVAPGEPMKVVNTGGVTKIVGGQTGNVHSVLPNTVSPNTVATTNQSNINNIRTTTTEKEIAGMPARSKDGPTGAGSKTADPQQGLKFIGDIQESFDRLHKLQALPGEGGAVGNLVGTVGRTALGQAIGAKTGYSPAAQEREILAKNLANLQSNLIQSLPGNATRTRFEQEIQKKRLPDATSMTYETANRAIAQIRDAYETAVKAQQTVKATGSKVFPSNAPTLSPADAANLPSGAAFRSLDGRPMWRP